MARSAYSRRLKITVAGRWYVGITIGVGVTAITSGNNTIYVMESLLLSGLILSGIMAERTIRAVTAILGQGPAIAQQPARRSQWVVLENQSPRHLFCVEVGEWKGRKLTPLAFCAHLRPHERRSLIPSQIYPERGAISWDAVSIATRYPFGFAAKIRFQEKPGERLIWPAVDLALARAHPNPTLLSHSAARRMGRTTPQQDRPDLRIFAPGDDVRLIQWTLSAKGVDWVVRSPEPHPPEPEFLLDLRRPLDPERFEERLSNLATQIYLAVRPHPPSATGASLRYLEGEWEPLAPAFRLTVLAGEGSRHYQGAASILNFLATVTHRVEAA